MLILKQFSIAPAKVQEVLPISVLVLYVITEITDTLHERVALNVCVRMRTTFKSFLKCFFKRSLKAGSK